MRCTNAGKPRGFSVGGVGLLVVGLLVAACGREPPAASDLGSGSSVAVDRRARGLAAMTRFRDSLSQMLVGVMQAEGPVRAIDVCSGQAPALARAASQDGLRIGRATDRPRNPGNTASGWQADALAAFAASPSVGGAAAAAPFERVLDDGRLALALPLRIQPPCLTCHGASIAPDVAAALAARYPADRATGYALGDLRGVLWAELE
jgi:hypothetical protein